MPQLPLHLPAQLQVGGTGAQPIPADPRLLNPLVTTDVFVKYLPKAAGAAAAAAAAVAVGGQVLPDGGVAATVALRPNESLAQGLARLNSLPGGCKEALQ